LKHKSGKQNGFKVYFQTGAVEKDPLKKRIRLTIIQELEKDSNVPYEFKVVLVGFFEIQKKYYEESGAEKAERMAVVNGPSVLYSAARELLGLISGRGPYRNDNVEILLPTISFLNFEGKEEKAKKRPGQKIEDKKIKARL